MKGRSVDAFRVYVLHMYHGSHLLRILYRPRCSPLPTHTLCRHLYPHLPNRLRNRWELGFVIAGSDAAHELDDLKMNSLYNELVVTSE